MEDEDFDSSESEEEPEDVYVDPSPTAPTTIGQPLALNRKYVDPPPFLDVLSFHSSRLLPVALKDIKAHERQLKNKLGVESNSSSTKTFKRGNLVSLTSEEEAARLDALLSSVHLLLEPIQLPDLSHTGVFDPATSLLRPVTPAESASKPEGEPSIKMKLSKVDKSDDVKLFYPTGAKNSNMRDYIKETIQKHFSTADLGRPPNDQTLGASASAPIFRSPAKAPGLNEQHRSTSPSKARAFGKTKKRTKLNAIKSPVKAALKTGALLNPQLTRQAKDIVAAVRANSSKINELISK
ncbi:hypothetical protein PR003_g14680 [Phytophthora rubi]|uniref:Uncharacterized protein n=1 Tax=Phytophthora rubi TaxID=129364 RepID=A0A6A3LTT5_9STRA|nr:hypothetical protein PR002_g12209 [Phytophthora rubi]KAE9027886.1 hypothetical protein PR001_g11872 [Phytophthora rubi]KAE9332121.1 hypothetical protein PR003_g14680 [Phytophthora rubi]